MLGEYHPAGSTIASAEQREQIPVDAWQEPRQGRQMWHVARRLFEYKLKSFMAPAEPRLAIDSIELKIIH